MPKFDFLTNNQPRRYAFLFLTFCLLFLAQNAVAQQDAALFNFSGGKEIGSKQMSMAAVEQQNIKINFNSLLPSAFTESGLTSARKLQIPLLDGKKYEAEQPDSRGFIQYNADEYTWRGKIKIGDFSGDVILTVKNGAMSELIYSPTAVYEIVPQENFQHLLVEIDQSLFLDCGGSLKPPTVDKSRERVNILEQSTQSRTGGRQFVQRRSVEEEAINFRTRHF